MEIVKIETAKTHYSAEAAAEHTLTVGDLIRLLEQYDDSTPVVFSNDNGYTFGRICNDDITEYTGE